MRISAVTQSYQAEVRKVENVRKNEKTQKAKSSVDSSEISSSAQKLDKSKAQVEILAAQIQHQPDVRMEKVEEVREKIRNGYYNSSEFIDKLADKLIQDFGLKGLS